MPNSKTSSAAASGSRRPAANLHQVKKRDETKHSRPRRVLKSRLCWYVPYKPYVSRDKVSGVPHIKWKCPPTVGVLDPCWQVAHGEESHEAKNEEESEKTVPEALYPCPTAIPPSPLSGPGEEYNDAETPEIPLIGIEDLVDVDTKVEAEKAPEAATEDIDKELIKILSNPEMVKKKKKKPKDDAVPPTINRAPSHHQFRPPIIPNSYRPMTMSSVPIHEDLNRLIDDYGRRPHYHASTIIPPPNVEEFMNTRILTRNIPSMQMLPPSPMMQQQLPPHLRFGPEQHHHNYIPTRGLGLQPATSVVSPKPNCMYFTTSRGCRNGSKCRFKHERAR